jgi:putative NADH-flavin reductase
MEERTKILVYGATGAVGRHIVAEAVGRGHDVTGVARHPRPEVASAVGVPIVRGDATDPDAIRRLARGYDVVVSATRPAAGREAELVETARSLVAGLSGTGCRLLVVGGASSLVVPASDGTLVLDDPRYVRDEWRAIAQACVDQFGVVQRTASPSWTYVSPPAFLEHGPRTGSYRRDTVHLVVDEFGRSRISYADFSVAIVDEIEDGRSLRGRVAVGW